MGTVPDLLYLPAILFFTHSLKSLKIKYGFLILRNMLQSTDQNLLQLKEA